MYNRNAVRLYLGISWQHFVSGFGQRPRTGYTRVIGNCIGSGRGLLSDSLKQRERENSPCASAVLLYSIIYTPAIK